jgi:hypothetical protein
MFKFNLEIGDVILLVEGKNNKIIGHSPMGKIIFPTNKVKTGYAKILTIEEKEKYILCKLENIVKDYYYDISYDEFLQVLKLNGYKIGFDIPFQSPYEYGEERQIFAYNLNINTVIVAETFYGKKSFNSINVYCPNMNMFTLRWNIAYHGGCNMSVLNLCNERGSQANLLETINNMMLQIKETKGIEWTEKESPSLWNYSDSRNDENGVWNLWDKTIDRILLADKEETSFLEIVKE